MGESHKSFIVIAHQDDWQLFMGSGVYARIRDPLCRLVIICTTAGNGQHDEYHWKSRLSGAVLSVCRGLPSWSPYSLNGAQPAALPSAFSVAYECIAIAGKSLLRCEIRGGGASVALYFLHLPEPMAALHTGQPVTPLWPDGAAPYRSWSEVVQTIESVLLSEAGEETLPMIVRTADRDQNANPGDHPDHQLTAQAVSEIARRHAQFRPVWYSMYANQAKPENLDGRRADDQRSAVYAYGGGYMATAAGFGETWRTGWEREYPAFKRREYPNEHPDDPD